ncbi:MAG: sugar ABC transporter ATP-binding protein [Solirubrobacteraceae bacterium]
MVSDVASVPLETAPALAVRGVSKAFPGVQALTGVDLEVRAGEIHALVGENGAGKSTLMRIIAGFEAPDEGEVLLDGRPAPAGHLDGRGHEGVGMVHQERSLVENLSVGENLFAGQQPAGPLGVIRWREMAGRARDIFDQLQEPIDPRPRVATLSPARQQMVEIAKALAREPRVLILDEPTAALTLTETTNLFAVLRRLRAHGVAIVYISHRLVEVFELADRVTVLKDGVVTGRHPVSEVDEDRLIGLMVGRELSFERSQARVAGDAEVALEVRHLAVPPVVHDASFGVRRGEIVCLAGLIGAGRTETCEAIFGLRSSSAGKIVLDGRPRRVRSAAEARGLGLGMVPEGRKDSGLFLDFSILANVLAANLAQAAPRGVISRRRARALAADAVERLGVVASSLEQPVRNLSGGNQQKLLLGRWLMTRPKVLIVDEPTRGVDVGARAQIYGILRDLAAQGMAILVVSSDLPELLTLAHRIVVFREGRTAGELDGATATEEQVVRLAAVQTNQEAVP